MPANPEVRRFLPSSPEIRPAPENPLPSYKEALIREGLGHLVPLLNAWHESQLFDSLAVFARDPQSPPQDFDQFCRQYRIEPEILLPDQLPGVCAKREGRTVPTPIGASLARVIEAYPIALFLTEGLVAEMVNIKPRRKQRPMPAEARAFTPSAVRLHLGWGDALYRSEPPPPIDLDVCIVTTNPLLGLEQIQDKLAKGPFRRGEMGKVVLRQSRRRRGLRRLDLSTTGIQSKGEPGFVFCNLFFPEDSRRHYGPDNRLLQHLMSRNSLSSAVILLVPIEKYGKLVSFRGVKLDFFGYQQWVKRTEISNRRFSLATYRFPEFAFPNENPPEAFAHLLDELGTWAWLDALPLMEINPSGEAVFRTQGVSVDPLALRKLSQRTANWIAKSVVYPLAQDPRLLGGEGQRAADAEELLDDLRRAMNGDPLLTTTRCLPPEIHPDGVPAWGMGIFDEKGFFPHLGAFLREENRWRSLVGRMKTCPRGPAALGWDSFVNFLFKATDNNASEVARLLVPNIYPGTQQRFLKTFLAEQFDRQRFARAVGLPRITNQDRALAVLSKTKQPLTTKQVAQATQISRGAAFQALKRLTEKGTAAQLGGKRGRKDAERIGTGGQQAFWATPEVAEAFPMPALQESVIQAIIEGADSIQAIDDAIGIKRPTLRLILERLEKLRLITISKRKRKGPQEPRLLISPTEKLLESH